MITKNNLRKFISAGHTFSDEESHLKQKVQFLMSVVILSIIISFIGGTIRFTKADYFVAIVDYTYIFSSLIMLYQVKKNKYSISLMANILVAIIYAMVILISFYGGYNSRLTIWFILIGASFFLLDKKYISPFFILILTTNIILYKYTQAYIMYTDKNIFLFIMLLIIVFTVFYTYEKQQNNNLQRVKELNKNLENLVKKRATELQANLDELKSTQTQLIESEKMASLGTLVAGVAHEINTPVGVALTGITHLEDELSHLKKIYEDETISEEDFYSFLDSSSEINQSIQINIKRAAELVRSFKQVAIDQSSQEDREINIKSYVDDVLLSLGSKFKQTNHIINVDIDDDLVIKTNPGTISQILTNLLMNSLIHAFKDGDNGVIDIKLTELDGRVTLIYKDNGVGLSSKVKKHIFDPFFTTNRNHGGSGLGMNIVYNLVKQNLGGAIKINSPLDGGVEFIINF